MYSDSIGHIGTIQGMSCQRITKLGLVILFPLMVSCTSSTVDINPVTEDTDSVKEEPYTEGWLPEPDCTRDANGRFVVCGDENIGIEHSQRGAAYRYRSNSTIPGDLLLYLTDKTKYEARLEQILGKAELLPGGTMPTYGLYYAAFASVTPSMTYQHEWTLANGDHLVEQIMFLDSPKAAATAIEEWRNAAIKAGIDNPKGFEVPDNSYTVVYRAPDNVDPDRRCVAQTLALVKNILVSASYLTGGDCSNLPINVPSIVLFYVLQDIETITS